MPVIREILYKVYKVVSDVAVSGHKDQPSQARSKYRLIGRRGLIPLVNVSPKCCEAQNKARASNAHDKAHQTVLNALGRKASNAGAECISPEIS